MASPDETASAKKPPSWLINAIAPFALALAGRRWFPAWAQLRHRGRRTGKEYVIPVAVLTRPDAFVIGLPWGTGTNWVRNVIAAGGCGITWKGTEYQVTEPRLVDKEVALASSSGLQHAIIARVDFPAFLQLTRSAG